MKTLTVKVPEELDLKLGAVAAQRNESKSALIRAAIEDLVGADETSLSNAPKGGEKNVAPPKGGEKNVAPPKGGEKNVAPPKGGEKNVSCLDLASDLSGCLEGAEDLSHNEKYLRGYGQ